MGTLRVLHLAGSACDDLLAELSRLYGQAGIESVADPGLYTTLAAHVTPDGRWRFPADLSREAIADAEPLGLPDAVRRLAGLDLDVMVPHMFCVPGMTTYRALFDLLGVPYLGSPAAVMALAADKPRTKAVVAAAGVLVPPGEVLGPGERPTAPLPLVVKPVDADNSLGVALVREAGDLDGAVADAFAHSPRVLVERYVELGREVRCGVVERDGELVCLPLEEYRVDPEHRPIRTYADKLRQDPAGGLELVAKKGGTSWVVDVDDPLTETVQAVARACHVALGCRDYSLFDFRVDPQGRPWFIEAGLYCSFAPNSVVSVMAAAVGTSLPELFATAVTRAVPGWPAQSRTTARPVG